MAKLGLIINPVAGMGGAVGLKGTDTEEILLEALRRGAKPVAARRASEFLAQFQNRPDVSLLTAGHQMGANVAKELGMSFKTLEGTNAVKTSRADTIRLAREMIGEGVDLLVFVGGDGTAKDVLEAVGDKTTVLGVPAGVKVFSSTFAVNPRLAAETAFAYLDGRIGKRRAEVLDVDEDAYRRGRLTIVLRGYLPVPDSSRELQNAKSPSEADESDAMREVADYFVEDLINTDHVYVLGPGLTVGEVARRMGFEKKTLLGVDVVKGDGTVLVLDASESQLLGSIETGKTHIIISPIGGQGFLLGRGNQQISPSVLGRVGVENLIIIATRNKVGRLWPRRLLVDTGDAALDKSLHGHRRVIIGYREEMILKIE